MPPKVKAEAEQSQISELFALASVYELDPNKEYLFVLDVSKIELHRFVKGTQGAGIRGRIIPVVGENALRVFTNESEDGEGFKALLKPVENNDAKSQN